MTAKLLGLVLVVGLVLCAWQSEARVTSRSVDECSALGFLKNKLHCSLCETLLQRTANPSLHEECQSCCSATTADGDDADFVEPSYVKARIEYKSEQSLRDTVAQQTELHTFAQKFVDSAPYKAKLQFIEDRTARMPRLVLVTEHGGRVDVRIENWFAHQIDEFLRKKLVQA